MWPWTYFAKLARVVDGDTYDVEIDMGFHCWTRQRVRLLCVNTPEVRGPEREQGLAATEYVRGLFSAHHPVFLVQTHADTQTDSFGRYLARVLLLPRDWDGNREKQLGDPAKLDLASAIVGAGHGVWYMLE